MPANSAPPRRSRSRSPPASTRARARCRRAARRRARRRRDRARLASRRLDRTATVTRPSGRAHRVRRHSGLGPPRRERGRAGRTAAARHRRSICRVAVGRSARQRRLGGYDRLRRAARAQSCGSSTRQSFRLLERLGEADPRSGRWTTSGSSSRSVTHREAGPAGRRRRPVVCTLGRADARRREGREPRSRTWARISATRTTAKRACAARSTGSPRPAWSSRARPLYRTEPWGVTDQPPFVNAAALVDTALAAARAARGAQSASKRGGTRRDLPLGTARPRPRHPRPTTTRRVARAGSDDSARAAARARVRARPAGGDRSAVRRGARRAAARGARGRCRTGAPR